MEERLITLVSKNKLATGILLVLISMIAWAMVSLLPIILTVAFIAGILLISYGITKYTGFYNIISWVFIAVIWIFAIIVLTSTNMFKVSVGTATVASVSAGSCMLFLFIGLLVTIAYILYTDKP